MTETEIPPQLVRDLQELAQRPGDAALQQRLAEHGLALLPALAEHLGSDLPIAALEAFEAVLKALLRREMAGPVSGPAARAIADFQRRLGPLLKYKSYAVKAASPLGYSLFLQNPGEGFSFQRHLTHKIEVFHILDVHPGGFVFLCTHDQWREVYDRARFAAWLAGERADAAYDRFRIAAQPGDVFVLDELGIVHTVVGCTLEEFATVSTDMVDRLHDQNEGKPIPEAFRQDAVRRRLRAVATPDTSRLVTPPTAAGRPTAASAPAQAEPQVRPLPAEPMPGGRRRVLVDGFVVATLYEIDPEGRTAPLQDPERAAALYVRQGRGQALLGTAAEHAAGAVPPIPIAAGDLLTIPPGVLYVLVNEGSAPLELAEHRIHPHVALF